PVLARVAERLASVWEPVAANATPKVASAAVVVAGSLPMIAAPSPPAPVHRQTTPHHAMSVVQPIAHAAHHTPAPPVSAARTTPQHHRAARAVAGTIVSAATTIALRQDCQDGTIDGHFSPLALKAAIGRAGEGGEYSDCRQALYQAMWRNPGAPQTP
ncbi:MAG TPA: hypothetical protein VGM33_06725, partial [Baekduia sp.]